MNRLWVKGPDKPGGYLTKGEYQAKMDHQDEVLGYINNKEGRFGSMSEKELAQEIADVKKTKEGLKVAMEIEYPPTGYNNRFNSYKVFTPIKRAA